jgi:C4-type Zn-finger protein
MSIDKTLEEEYFCPTCGKSMQLQEKKEDIPDENNLKGKIQFWYCLNCSIEWQVDILNNILRKNSLIEE